jgi:hypothetical protein
VQKKRVVAAAVVVFVGIAVLVVYSRGGGRNREQCEAEAQQILAKLKDRESIYGTAVLADGNKVMMRDNDGRIHSVEQDVFARQLGAGWKQATREDVRARHVAECLGE